MKISRVCPECFGAPGLRKRIEKIRPDYKDLKCSLHSNRKGVPIAAVAKIIDQVFRDNYTFGQVLYPWAEGQGGTIRDVLNDFTGAETVAIVGAVLRELEASDNYRPGRGEHAFYDDDLRYVRSETLVDTHGGLWEEFCETLVFDQRFFNPTAKRLIAQIFEKVHLLRDTHGRSPVRRIMPGSSEGMFLRGRLAVDARTRQEILDDTAQHLGPPPRRSRRAGRMNASGVSAFYGAFEIDTCIAELRPAVGSVVGVAQFKLVEPITVLDMTSFAAPPKSEDVFAEDVIRRTAQWRFMSRFMQEIRKPVSPTDEYLDYIPTQAVAEYLVHHQAVYRDGARTGIDGIIYGSAQYPSGRNIVLLGNAALVDTGDAPLHSSPRLRPVQGSVEFRVVEQGIYTTARYDPISVEAV